jgi:TonB family protein
MKLVRFLAAVVFWSLTSYVFAVPQNDGAQPQRLRVAPKAAAALLKYRVDPAHAPGSRVPDDVILRIVIDQQGRVVEAVRDEFPLNRALPASTEDRRMREAAVEAAVKAVKQWEYTPYLLDGRPVEVETQVVVDFGFRPRIGNPIAALAPPPKVAVPTILKLSPEVLERNLLKHEDPVDPAMAGEAMLLARIGKTGAVEHVEFVSGHLVLMQPAMDAVRQRKYKPFLLNGEPVAVESTVHVTLALPPNDGSQPQRVLVAPGDTSGLLQHHVDPEYPWRAPVAHIPNNISLRIVIDRQGRVIEAAPLSRDELATEDPHVREAAVEAAVKAVKQWEYQPYLFNGRPVEVETRVAAHFANGEGSGVIGGIVSSGFPSFRGVPYRLPPQVVPASQMRILQVSAEVMERNLLQDEHPVYPALARKAHIQGEVVLRARISKTGVVEHVQFVSGSSILMQPAMDAVRQWKYKPFLLNEEPVEVEGSVHVTFKM